MNHSRTENLEHPRAESVSQYVLPISVCILTNRADDRFNRCLKSVKQATEIVVLDNESGAHWEKLRALYPQLVVHTLTGVINDFAKARRECLAHATHDWVLVVDSDEVVPENTWKQLQTVMESDAVGATITRRDVFLGRELRHAEGGTLRLLRFFLRTKVRVAGRVHEVFTVPGKVEHTSIVLQHFAHHSLSAFLQSVFYYAHLAATDKTSGRLQTIMELLIYPPAKLLTALFLMGGILDGWRGITYAVVMSLHSLFVRVYRYEELLKK